METPGEPQDRRQDHLELRDDVDDVDRAFGRLTPLPAPRGFTTGVMLAVAAARPVRLSVPWLTAAIVCVLAIGALGFWTGQALVGGGMLDLLATLASDADVLGTTPGEALLALFDVAPWIELLGIGGGLGALSVLLRRLGSTGRGAPRATAGGA